LIAVDDDDRAFAVPGERSLADAHGFRQRWYFAGTIA
jgi:hypothetical protein